MKCINCIHRKDDVCTKSGNAIANFTLDEVCDYVRFTDICPFCKSNHTEVISHCWVGKYEEHTHHCIDCDGRYVTGISS